MCLNGLMIYCASDQHYVLEMAREKGHVKCLILGVWCSVDEEG